MSDRLKLHLVLYSPADSNAGVPAVYHPYFIVASPWQLTGSGIATVVSLNQDSPVPETLHILADNGGPAAAMRLARDAILALPGNRGLSSLPASLDEFQSW